MQNQTTKQSNIQIQIKIIGYHHYYINRIVLLLRDKLKTNLPNLILQQIFLPEKIEHYTVLRSPHVDKKARDQFSRNIQSRLVILSFTSENISTTLRHLNKLFSSLNDAIVGVSIKVRTIIK